MSQELHNMTAIGYKQRQGWLNRLLLVAPAFGPLVLWNLPIPIEYIFAVWISNRSFDKQFPHIVTIRDVMDGFPNCPIFSTFPKIQVSFRQSENCSLQLARTTSIICNELI